MIRARKRFGQHFLEPAWVDKVVKAIDPRPDQSFIEIGPGPGALTRPLAARARSVTAVEIDRDLAAALTAEGIPNLTVVAGDFLEIAGAASPPASAPRDLDGGAARFAEAAGPRRRQPLAPSHLPLTLSHLPFPAGPCRVAGNLPYNVASPIMFKLIELHAAGVPLLDATLMLQREVADRLVAPPGSREYGVLSILIGRAADVETVLKLPAGAFRPAPKVLSSLVRLRFRAPRPAVLDDAVFDRVVQAVFTRRRKTMSNALRAFTADSPTQLAPTQALAAAELDGSRRPETLSIPEFARLADAYVLARRAVL